MWTWIFEKLASCFGEPKVRHQFHSHFHLFATVHPGKQLVLITQVLGLAHPCRRRTLRVFGFWLPSGLAAANSGSWRIY